VVRVIVNVFAIIKSRCVLKWSLLVVKNGLGHAQIGLPEGVLGKTPLYLVVRVKVFDDNVFAIIKSRCICYLSVF